MARSIKISLKVPDPAPSRYSLLVTIREIEVQQDTSNALSNLLVISTTQCNFNELYNQLHTYGVIDRRYQWSFGNKHLIILGTPLNPGDILQVECLWLIYSLEEKAKKSGGKIYYLPSHQILKDTFWAYEQPSYARNEDVKYSKYVALYEGNRELLRWLKTKRHAENIEGIVFTNEYNNIDRILQHFDGTVLVTANHLQAEGVNIELLKKLIKINTSEKSDVLFIKSRNIYILRHDGSRERIGNQL